MATITALINRHGTALRQNKKSLIPWLFVIPALLLNVFVVAAPTAGTLLLSLTNWDGFRKPKFIGIQNYITLLGDSNFFIALANNFKWLLYFATLPVAFALVMAVIVSKVTRFQMFYRSVFFMPNIISTIVTAKIWTFIYNPFFGVPAFLEKMGLEGVPLFLGDTSLALFSVAFVDSWRYWGFLMVLFLTALQQADKNLEEAAIIDGAGKLKTFWNVILPQLRPTVMMMLMLTMIWSFGAFDYVYVMTGGGPGRSTELLATYMYKLALRNQAPGYASTIALAMALFSFAIMSVFGLLRKRGWDI